ncbi:MAG: hypothetical protein EOM65_11785 [Synergistales bacterium]|nr:hypothetical protein [Synergistales bacterium]
MKHLMKVYDLAPYPRKLFVVAGCDPSYIKRSFLKEDATDYDLNLPFSDEEISKDLVDACTVMVKESATGRLGYLIYIPSLPVTPTVIVHECGHAIVDLFGNMGIPIENQLDEPFCYSLGYAFERVSETVAEARKKLRPASKRTARLLNGQS